MITLLTPQWAQPAGIMAGCTTRYGGVSQPPWQSLNLGDHCGDNAAHVAENRQRLAQTAGFPSEPVWLEQVHGNQVLQLDSTPPHSRQADASWTDRSGVVCVVLTADCLPVLLCDRAGQQVAAVHAGWRGLCAGILERTVACFHGAPRHIMAWLGPAISAQAFEVGQDVRLAFMAHDQRAARAFRRCMNRDKDAADKYLADLYQLARWRLQDAGVTQIYGGDYCTYLQSDDFFSWRRDVSALHKNAVHKNTGCKNTGRMASFIWRQ